MTPSTGVSPVSRRAGAAGWSQQDSSSARASGEQLHAQVTHWHDTITLKDKPPQNKLLFLGKRMETNPIEGH